MLLNNLRRHAETTASRRTKLAVTLSLGLTAPVSFAATSNLEQELFALKAKVEQLEVLLKASQAAQAPAASPAPAPALDNKVRAIERRLEVASEQETVNRLKTPIVTLGDKGLSILSPDGLSRSQMPTPTTAMSISFRGMNRR